MHTVQYKSSRSEVWRWYWRSWARPNGLWLYHLFLGIAFAVIYIILSNSQFTVYGLLSASLIGFLVCIIFFPIYPQIVFKSSLRTLIIDESGISTTIGNKSGNRTWQEVKSIESRDGRIIITGKNKNAFIIPRRAFRHDAEQEEFLRDAIFWHGENT